MSSGIGGQIAIARIGSLYTDVNTLNIWSNFTQESLEHTLGELEEGSLIGRRDTPPSHKGVDSGAGDIQIEPNPNALAYFVQGFMGTRVSSTVTVATSTGANSAESAGLAQYFHRWTPRQDAFSDRTFLEPHNVGVYRDTGSMWIHKGAIFQTLKFDIEAGALAKATVGIMSRKVDLIQRTAAITSLSRAGGRPWVWDMASVEVSTDTSSANLAATTHFERISLSFEMPHEGVSFLDGTKLYGEFVPNDFRRIRIDGTMSFRDQAEYVAFKTYEARRMRITMLNVNSALMLGNPASLDSAAFLGYYGLRFHLPQMKYLSWSAPISGPNRLTASFTAKAEYSDTEGFMAAIEMNNIVSSVALSTTY
jgi:hypothetical protein